MRVDVDEARRSVTPLHIDHVYVPAESVRVHNRDDPRPFDDDSLAEGDGLGQNDPSLDQGDRQAATQSFCFGSRRGKSSGAASKYDFSPKCGNMPKPFERSFRSQTRLVSP